MIDTSRTIEIAASPAKMLGLLFGAVIMFIAASLMAFGFLQGRYPAFYVQTAGWIGMVFFGPLMILGVWQLVARRGPVVTISRDGFRDKRIAAELIPWRAIQRISILEMKRIKIMVLTVEPTVLHMLTLTRVARLARSANGAANVDKLWVSDTDLKIGFDALFEATSTHWRAHGRPARG